MRKTHMTTTIATLVLLAGGPVQARQQSADFQTLDTDANGYISQEEAAANPDISTRWMNLDTDKNNVLDKSEFSAFETGTEDMMNQDRPMQDGGTAPAMPGRRY
ncbi:MAG: hypothetical protein HY941_00110 [Gammaproteobacteria bacterium]|nr:hypothetical protein [Gammaproteobacteria bacterium]